MKEAACNDDSLVMLSALQHYLFCRRQCALIHLEQSWAENRLTASGRILHERVDERKSETRRTLRQATAVPTATPAPTAAPTPTPTTRPVETLSGVIDANASKEDIRKVQQLLVDIGMLSKKGVDGVYGSGTISAVADFQQWVNMQRQEQTLPVNGEVDQLTLAYLQYCVDHGMRPYGTVAPQVTPTPRPAATPPLP